MTEISDALRAAFDRIKAITETPEYQANLARLANEEAEYERKQAEHRHAFRLKVTGVPPEVAEQAVKVTVTTTVVADFLAGPAALRFLMLGGKKGTGKTFAIAHAIWTNGGRYVDAQQLVAAGTFDGSTWTDLASTSLLALDELGAEHPNPAFEANLYALLDRRYRTGKRTLIATNLNATDFKARYCENGLDRLIDRLKTGGQWVSLDGESLRQNWAEASP
jgi:DNA replication protein DnaC